MDENMINQNIVFVVQNNYFPCNYTFVLLSKFVFTVDSV